MAYRHKYHRDVFVNYVCYRRWGHNEMDEPAFTQPLMYRTIRTRPSIPDRYVEKLQVRCDQSLHHTVMSHCYVHKVYHATTIRPSIKDQYILIVTLCEEINN